MVRQLRPADAEAYVLLRREALIREPRAFASSPADDAASSLEFVREAFANPLQATIGAFAPDLVGSVGLGPDRHQKSAHKAHIWGLYVQDAQRGRGIGRSLMQAALGIARTWPGVALVHLSVADSATAARQLYEQLGFMVWASEADALRVEGVSVTEYHMVYRL